MKNTLIILMALVLAFPADAKAGDREDVIEAIEKQWADVAQRKVDKSTIHPDGQWLAKSAGGLWEFLTADETVALIEDAPNTFDFKPYHVNVKFLGARKDVAYVAYYLAGNILGKDKKPIIANYRTRASGVSVKIGGKWVAVGAHYSPLYGGSGVVFE